MQLNLPILHLLENSKNILIAGAGGGFDIFAGLPLFFALRELGKSVHLANYSFTPLPFASLLGDPVVEIEHALVGMKGKMSKEIDYFPEGYLAQWFHEQGKDEIIWMMPSSGAPLIQQSYERLIRKLKIDALILVDGGVDSLMRGDEANPGSLLEDTISLVAVEPLDIPVKIMACVGFGSEVEEDLCHYTALENMAMLIKQGGFYGSCALTPQMDAFKQYESACLYAWDGENRHKSHISTRIIPAVNGEFGNFQLYPNGHYLGDRQFISPLMSLYWFFDADTVVKQSLIADLVRDKMSKDDALYAVLKYMDPSLTRKRPRRQIPY